MTEDKKRFVMRMPAKDHLWLVNRAKENGRSANAEAQQILKEARKKEK